MIQFLTTGFLVYVVGCTILFLIYTYLEFQNAFPLFQFFIHPKMKKEYKEMIMQLNRDYNLQKQSIILFWPIYLTIFAIFGLGIRK